MNSSGPFVSLLVPVDFSNASRDAFQRALHFVSGDNAAVIVLHVVDESLVKLISAHGYGEESDVTARLRAEAADRLSEYSQPARPDLQIDTLVSVGIPFVEIVRKSEDFAVDAIVMGMVGTGDRFEKLLFGSTAEKVLRGSRRPVIVLPRTTS